MSHGDETSGWMVELNKRPFLLRRGLGWVGGAGGGLFQCTLHVSGWIIFGFRILLRSGDTCSGTMGDQAKKKQRPALGSTSGDQRRYLSAA